MNIDMGKLNDEITEVIGRTVYFKDEQAKGATPELIDTDEWLIKYHGDIEQTAGHYMQSLEFNIFRNEVQHTVNSVMAIIQKEI